MATTIGVVRLTLYLEETFSLKDKRQIVRSLTQKMRNQFNAAVAETADLDDARLATIVAVVVSNSAPHADEMLAAIVRFADARLEAGALGDVETELIPYGD
jgi:uncharacterized protein